MHGGQFRIDNPMKLIMQSRRIWLRFLKTVANAAIFFPHPTDYKKQKENV
jgi:hypothetical protein